MPQCSWEICEKSEISEHVQLLCHVASEIAEKPEYMQVWWRYVKRGLRSVLFFS